MVTTTTIIGSGVVGVAQALYTALRGDRARVLDAATAAAGRGASVANSGYICPGLAADPPGLAAAARYCLLNGMRVQSPAPAGAPGWAARLALRPLAPGWPAERRRLERWAALSAEEWARFEGPPRGAVRLRRAGPHDDRRAELARRVPALCLDRVRGHLWCPGDTFVDPEAAVGRLRGRWPAGAVEHWPGTEVVGFRAADTHAPGRRRRVTHLRVAGGGADLPAGDRVVLAAGAGTPALLAALAALGDPLRLPPLLPLCGYSVDAERTDGGPPLTEVAISDLDRGATLAPLPAPRGAIRIAGFADLAAAPPPRWAEARQSQLEAALRALLPGVPLRVVRRWCGVRLATPTGAPLVGRVEPWENVFINAGHGRVGMTLSLGTARWLAAHMAA